MEWFINPEIWIGLITLTTLEVVLGIDNVVFISILASKLPDHQHTPARKVGHSANVLAIGPGGYRFSDFLKVGIPLTLIVLAVILLIMPVFWPF